MRLRDFVRAGHWPTLLSAFLYFDISFMVWVLIGALAPSIKEGLRLDDSRDGFKIGFMIATPILGGSLLRLVLGVLTDHIGARRTGLIGLTLTMVPLLLGWLWAGTFPELLLVGLMLGVAGASFAVALPLAGRWYPPQYQGLAMGIAGAGNSGTALATLFGPLLANSLGWHAVFGLALVPVTLTLVVFLLLARDAPGAAKAKRLADYVAVLKLHDTWWFCLFYSVTFGGFVGLASFLNTFFVVQYSLTKPQAGLFTTGCVIAGSCLRPVGGYLADRFGGIRMLMVLYVGAGAMMLGVATMPPLAICFVLLFAGMGMLGMGNGSVFQLVPQRFPQEIGVLTGIVGAAGGLGGFFLPNLLGGLKQLTDSFAGGFLAFAVLGFACAGLLKIAARTWEGTFVGRGGLAAIEMASADAVTHRPESGDLAPSGELAGR
jgi:NNP family nitrate/nitrite transporter-like MFS transporter